MWSVEKRAERLEYMHPKPSSHFGRIVGNPEVICPGSELVMGSRLVVSNAMRLASAFKGSNERLSRVHAYKDEGHSDASSIKRVTCSSDADCSVFSMKNGSLSAAAKSRM